MTFTNTWDSHVKVFKWYGVLGHESALYIYTGPGITWAIEMNLVMTNDTGVGSMNQSADLQSSALPLS